MDAKDSAFGRKLLSEFRYCSSFAVPAMTPQARRSSVKLTANETYTKNGQTVQKTLSPERCRTDPREKASSMMNDRSIKHDIVYITGKHLDDTMRMKETRRAVLLENQPLISEAKTNAVVKPAAIAAAAAKKNGDTSGSIHRATARVQSIASALREAARREAEGAQNNVWLPSNEDNYIPPPVHRVHEIAKQFRDAAKKELTRPVAPVSFKDSALMERIRQQATLAQRHPSGIVKPSVVVKKMCGRRIATATGVVASKTKRVPLKTKSTAPKSKSVPATIATKEDPYVAKMLESGMTYSELMKMPVEQLEPITANIIQLFSSGNKAQATVSASKQQHHFVYALMGRNGNHLYRGSFWRVEGSNDLPPGCSPPRSQKRKAPKPSTRKASSNFSQAKASNRKLNPPNQKTIKTGKACSIAREGTDDPFVASLLSSGKSRAEILQLPVEQLDRDAGAVVATFSSGLKAFAHITQNPRVDVFFHVLAGLPYERRRDNPRVYQGSFWRLKGSKIRPGY